MSSQRLLLAIGIIVAACLMHDSRCNAAATTIIRRRVNETAADRPLYGRQVRPAVVDDSSFLANLLEMLQQQGNELHALEGR